MGYRNIAFSKDTIFLVTGGAGFIGSNLCEAILNKGSKVRCLDNFSTGKPENVDLFIDNLNYEFIEGDIRDMNTCLTVCDGVDYVLHQAAWGSVSRSIEIPLVYEQINIQGMLNMMEAARQNNVKKFIYASSSSVYGDSSILPKKEGDEGNLLSPYALTKRTNEEYGKLYWKLYGLPTFGLRYFNVFGKRQSPHGAYAAVIPKWIKAILDREAPVIHGDGTQSRDFTYVENVVEANLKSCLASDKFAGQVFNIALGEREYLIDVYYSIANALDSKIEPIFTKPRKGDIKHSNANIEKAKIAFNYEPEYNFARGLENAIEWYKEFL